MEVKGVRFVAGRGGSFALMIAILVILGGQVVKGDDLIFNEDWAAYFDRFGAAVGVYSNNTIIGASSSAQSGAASGVAYIYYDSPSVAKLTPHDATTNDNFGCAVAISSNFAVVGAFGKDAARGAAYVYSLTGTTWSETAKLTASDAVPGDCFAGSLGLDGDAIIVGSREPDNGINSGAAYIFRRSGTAWQQESKLIPGQSLPDDRFGSSVGLSGDLAAVGAPGDGQGGICAGATYVFRRQGTNWVQEAKLVAADAQYGDLFGISVSLQSNRLIVGSSGNDQVARDAGAAYVFERTGTNWARTFKLVASDAQTDDRFGYSVGVSGNSVLVGAYKHNYYVANVSGSAYLFQFNGSGWTQREEFTTTSAGYSEPSHFGQAVSLCGGRSVVGAHILEIVYVFDRSP